MHTHSKNHSILEVGERLVALVTMVLSRVGHLCHLLIAVWIGAGFVEAVFRFDKRNGCLAAEVVWLVSMTKI